VRKSDARKAVKSAVEEFNCRQPLAVPVSPVRKTNEVKCALFTLQGHTGGVEVWFGSFLILTLEEGGLNFTPWPL
jgi:hypothetical protein